MDRTIIAVQRAEERELADRLYKKLQGLTLLHPPTDEFYKCFSEEMFLKPNQQAFFHVMHFLFCLLDAAEFKKRFYWPITDKRAESNFRTSTVEYLKYLNEKHQLQWGDIKSYLVVLPGGKKFITFLLELVGFVVQEQIKQHERQLNAEVETGEISELNLRRMRSQNAFFKEYASAYLSEMDEQIAIRRNEVAKLQQNLQTLAQKTGVSMAQLTDDAWQEEWAQHNAHLFAERYTKRAAEITSLEEPLEKLKQVVKNFHTKEAELKYDKASVRQALQKIREQFPRALRAENDGAAFVHPGGINNTAEGIGEDNIKLHVLIDAFNAIAPTLSSMLSKSIQLPSCSEFVTAELISLKQELQQIERQITDFQKMLNTQQRKCRNQKQVCIQCTPVAPTLTQHAKESGTLQFKFVYTPPIKLDMLSDERTAKLRLPLFDGLNKKPSETFNSFLAVPRSARKPRVGECAFDHNNSTLNKSKIVDPIELLRTISKGTGRNYRIDHNTSSTLSDKWRERQRLLHTELEVAPLKLMKTTHSRQNNSNVEECTQSYGSSLPCTPFNTKERTTISRKQSLEGIGSSSGSSGAGAVGTKVFYARKVAAVKKVQDDSLNIANMSTSPSGRLDALVTLDARETPKLKVNDITMREETIIVNASLDKGCVEVLKTSSTHLLLTTEPPAPNENDPNVSNLLHATPPATHPITDLSRTLDEDDIFNISDSVLKDVIM